MATLRLFLRSWLMVALVVLVVVGGASCGSEELQFGFYKKSCPKAEEIVRNTLAGYYALDPTVAAPVLRLHFHDCFVRGCDGSVLLNSTKTNVAEKDADINQTLDGFYVIDAAKKALEKACPGTVSCADIVAIAARDAVTLSLITRTNKNQWEVPLGRRDGTVSKASEAVAKMPTFHDNILKLKSEFNNRGLSTRDLAILSGSHAIGNSHCFSFTNRLYNFTGKGDADLSLDPKYAMMLRQKCKPDDTTTVLEMVPGSSTTFDTEYYKVVAKRRGLFESDAALLQDEETRDVVFSAMNGPENSFFFEFGLSMIKMGKIGVLTGNEGEIRKNCALVN